MLRCPRRRPFAAGTRCQHPFDEFVSCRAREAHNAKKDVKRRPYQLGQCHVYAEDSPAVLERWPDYYKPKAIAETNSGS